MPCKRDNYYEGKSDYFTQVKQNALRAEELARARDIEACRNFVFREMRMTSLLLHTVTGILVNDKEITSAQGEAYFEICELLGGVPN